MVATPQAQVDWITHGPRDMYLLYDQAHYLELCTPDGWWQRTLALDPYHGFRLRGTADINPLEAVLTILRQPDRPAFSLPALIVALFLARSAHPDTLAHCQLFRWVASAIPHLRRYLAAGSIQVGWNDGGADSVELSLSTLVNVLLQQDPQVPLVLTDGAWFHILDQLSDHLWRFPPDTMWAINSAIAKAHEDAGLEEPDQPASQLDAVTALGYLSAIRFWREPWPTIRGLPIHVSMLEFLPLWHQALVIIDPNAPRITDTQLAWLCDGTLGKPPDGPFDHLIRAMEENGTLNGSATEWQERIATLEHEADRGTACSHGCWEVQQTMHWPVFSMYQVARMRLVAGPEGCWVRLMPSEERWGSVLWWRSGLRAPTCWSLALGEAVTTIPLLALHATFWHIWRDLRVDGSPSRDSIRVA